MLVPLAALGAMLAAQVPAPSAQVEPLGAGPASAPTLGPRGPGPARPVEARRAPVPGLGPRLAARIRGAPPDAPVRFLAYDVDPALVRAEGGRVTAELGRVRAGWAPAGAIRRLARAAVYVDAPKPLRPSLDRSRVEVHADETDFGVGFDAPYRGAGALIAIYDTGVDLSHPDLRALDGPTRVQALWDQSRVGTPPPGRSYGHSCDREALVADTCRHTDRIGHGTSVLGVAASGGPRYRGVAPEADLLVAASDDFEGLLDALAWFDQQARALDRPMVVNLSLSGQEGPHDGTSLECQALDALGHVSVVAAGNEGALPVHALARLDKGDGRQFALRFPILPQPSLRRATVDIWGDVGLPLSAQVRLVRPGGAVSAETSTVTPGEEGRTEVLATDTATVGWVELDAEATPNPFNGQGHIRIGLELLRWEDDPEGVGYITVRVRGEGRIDLWVDSPASEPAPIRFDRDRVLDVEDQGLGDTEHTLSDLATAASPIAVSAYVSRTEFEDATGANRTVGGQAGQIASFSSFGPTLSPSTTGDKPDLAAPGLLVISARSRDAPDDPSTAVSPLYVASAGTSLAAPHVAGAAAVLLGAEPRLDRISAKAALLDSAADPGDADPRWGAGRLHTADALGQVVERASGCRCVRPEGPPGAAVVVTFALLAARRRRRIG